MTDTTLPAFWQRMDHAEQALCLRVNRACRRPVVRAFFAAVSRAGDGVLWYALMAAVALLDVSGGWRIALMMAITGATPTLSEDAPWRSDHSFRMPGTLRHDASRSLQHLRPYAPRGQFHDPCGRALSVAAARAVAAGACDGGVAGRARSALSLGRRRRGGDRCCARDYEPRDLVDLGALL